MADSFHAQGAVPATDSRARSGDDLVIAVPLMIETLAVRRGVQAVTRDASTSGRCVQTARVVRTGMGPGPSRKAVRRLLDDPARCLAVAGLAGAVVPGLEPGHVLVASELRRHGAEPLVLDTTGLIERLADAGLQVSTGVIAGVDHVVRGAERESIRAQGAAAVDMESAWLADARRDRPFAVVRVIVDAPGHELFSPSIVSRGSRALSVLARVAATLPLWAGADMARAA